ncbi:MAG TPA: delta-60 repeat domain-containing protein [Solirubrobacterales bacterium]|nr:delta-60 repeat domain-containing protein [Solirubrobacterales bacterium]
MTRLRLFLVALPICGLLAIVPAASAAPGDLDPSFGSGGMVKLLESEDESYAEGIAVQPDSKVVIAGEMKGKAVVARLLADGQPDPSFGSGGNLTTTVAGGSEFQAVAIQPDGKIVAAGAAEVAGNVDFLFARYNPDGSPDMSFGGGDGVETVPVGSEEDQAQDVAIAPDGRIVASGTSELPGSDNGVGVVVLRKDGSPDPSFGGDGSLVKETAIGEGDDRGVAVAMLGDGSVLLGDENGAGGGNGFTLIKLLPNGEFDLGFGEGDGIAFTPIPVIGTEAEFGAGRITDFAVFPDGRIIASGYGLDYFAVPPNPPTYHLKFAAVRWLANGELDTSFAEGGIFARRMGNEFAATSVNVAQGGGYLFAGPYEFGSMEPPQRAAWVGRLRPDGTPDPAFGSGGFVFRNETAPSGEDVENAAVDSADRLVTIGTAFGANTAWMSVTRYLGDPQPVAVPIAAPVAQNKPAHATMKAVPKKLGVGELRAFVGTAVDPDGNGVKKVQIALVKRARGGVKAKASATARLRCFALNSKLRFKRVRPKGKQCPQIWLTAKGTSKWSFKLKGVLTAGKYVVFARAVDGKGLAETSFSRKLKNRYGFRIVSGRGAPRLTTK